jgi:23S rRNA (adenine2503-C2)-methyltransferase
MPRAAAVPAGLLVFCTAAVGTRAAGAVSEVSRTGAATSRTIWGMADAPTKVPFFGLDAAGFDDAVTTWGWPRFRAQQVRDWVYGKLVADPERMTNLSKAHRQTLRDRVDFGSAEVAAHQRSSDGTQKLLLTWEGGGNAETVMIPDADRRTACVSSQVGCPVGCRFCASGMNGVKGNLTAAQIVEEVFRLNLVLQPLAERVTNIVFMGMGEPLANYANVMQAVRVLHDPKCFNLGARRITISTVGVPSKMRELAGEELPLNLALSLHAPNEPLRKELIPWAEHFALDDILDAARHYFDQTGREITLEYILLSGVNDRPEHARQLARLCKTLRSNVNLIRYNEVAGLPYLRPKGEDVLRFQEILRAAGVNAHVRKSRGRDIEAACGQLRRKEQERREQEARQADTLVTLNVPPTVGA